jgi:hypothetical protein
MSSLPTISKILVLDWYDGECKGILNILSLNSWFHFKLISWDENHRLRIFALETIKDITAQNVIDLCSIYSTPNWPYWTLNFLNYDPSILNDFNKKQTELLKLVDRTDFLGAWDVLPPKKILAWKKISDEMDKNIPYWFEHEGHNITIDWFDYLGLEKNEI